MGGVGAVSVQRLQNETGEKKKKKVNMEGQVATGWKQWNKESLKSSQQIFPFQNVLHSEFIWDDTRLSSFLQLPLTLPGA